jgi:hypothetical protein
VTGLMGVTRGNPVPVIPVTQVKVVALVSNQGVMPVTAQGHAPGQASEPGQTGIKDECIRSIEGRKSVHEEI